ncbi:MAG: GFA family protein [Alphaproteobacteria bacterium]|nr:GFA family protein [Alphaproteobacteria bacterium]
MPGTKSATGNCLCGAVSYTINADEPLRMAQCHCKDCQRASGTGHMSLAFFKAADVDIKGETASYAVSADSGNINTRHFCPKCGSRVYGENSARPGLIGLAVGCVDDNAWFKPAAVVYAKDRQEWDRTATDIANFDMMPPPA